MPSFDLFKSTLEVHGICSSSTADGATIVNLGDLVLPTGFTTVRHEFKEQGTKDDSGVEDAGRATQIADIKMSMNRMYDLVERQRCAAGLRSEGDAEHSDKILETTARMTELRDRVRAHQKRLNEHCKDLSAMEYFVSCSDDFMNSLAASNLIIVDTLTSLALTPDLGMRTAMCGLQLAETRYLESVERLMARMKFRRELEVEYTTMSTTFDELDRDLSNMADKLEQRLSGKTCSRRQVGRVPSSQTSSSSRSL